MLPSFLYWLILLAIVTYAFRRGALNERIAAMTCLCGTIATMLVSGNGVALYRNMEVGVLLVDFAGFAIFTGIALHSSRFWPLWAAGFQLSSTLAHFFRAIDSNMLPHVYAAAERFWIYPIFLAIAVGVRRTALYAQPRADSLPA